MKEKIMIIKIKQNFLRHEKKRNRGIYFEYLFHENSVIQRN